MIIKIVAIIMLLSSLMGFGCGLIALESDKKVWKILSTVGFITLISILIGGSLVIIIIYL